MQFRSHWETTTSRDYDYLASKPTLVCSPHNMLIVQRKVRVRHTTRSSRDPHASRKSKSERRKPTLSHVFFSFSLPFRFGFRIHDQDDRTVNASLFSMSPVKRAGYCSPKHETRPSRRQCYSPCSTLITHLESDQLFVVDHQPRVIVPDAHDVHKDIGHVDARGVVDTFEGGHAQRGICVLVLVSLFILVGVIDNVLGVTAVMLVPRVSRADVRRERGGCVCADAERVRGATRTTLNAPPNVHAHPPPRRRLRLATSYAQHDPGIGTVTHRVQLRAFHAFRRWRKRARRSDIVRRRVVRVSAPA